GTRILGGSGSSDFDHAVLDAFNAIPNLGPPPNGKGGTFSFRLRMRDEE
nr:TonB C-terminal domain-containing protein [Opitutaceae bacterium]